jgi:hypothetical protein
LVIAYWLDRHFKGTDQSKRSEVLSACEWLLGIVAVDVGAGFATGRPDSGLYQRHTAVRRAVDSAVAAIRR